jgi:hypothetical protein
MRLPEVEKIICSSSVHIGTIVACPIDNMNRLRFPRPTAKNAIKLIRRRGKALKAKISIPRVCASIGIPTVKY